MPLNKETKPDKSNDMILKKQHMFIYKLNSQILLDIQIFYRFLHF